MINLCTLCDQNYLPQAIALYRSLVRHVGKFNLCVLALDDVTHEVASDLDEERVFVTSLKRLEADQPELLKARAQRTRQEYCWTLASVWTLAAMERYGMESLAYVDADTYLFADVAPLYGEIANAKADIAIIPHRFPPERDKSQNGIYNVNWVYFRNTPNAMRCLTAWREQCVAWCYARPEDGKFGDQKYLDTWAQTHGAHVVEHLGANLAPWNQSQYFYEYDTRLYIIDAEAMLDYGRPNIRRIDPLLFYHFHEFKVDEQGNVRRGNYSLEQKIIEHVYAPYEREILGIAKELKRGKVNSQ